MRNLILFREKPSKFGGKENYLTRLSDQLNKVGFVHKIEESKAPRILPSWIKLIFFNIQICLTKSSSFVFSVERIICPDIYRAGDGVHKHFSKIFKRHSFNPLHVLLIFLEKICFNRSKLIIANSKMVKSQIIHYYKIEPSKIHVIYNGVPISKDSKVNRIPFEKNFLSKYKIKDKRVILFVGSGYERKGVSEFIEIIEKLSFLRVIAFIIGKERKQKKYKNLIKQKGLVNKINIIGPREDVENFFKLSDIVILPTYYDPFSNVVIEAMSHRNVVVTTRQNGAHEILDCKYIMNSPRDFSITKEIDVLLKNQDELERVKEKNFSLSKTYSIENNVKETIDVITKYVQ